MGFSCDDWPSFEETEQRRFAAEIKRQQNDRYVRAVAKAASALRFHAVNGLMTDSARKGLLAIAGDLVELEPKLLSVLSEGN